MTRDQVADAIAKAIGAAHAACDTEVRAVNLLEVDALKGFFNEAYRTAQALEVTVNEHGITRVEARNLIVAELLRHTTKD